MAIDILTIGEAQAEVMKHSSIPRVMAKSSPGG